MTPGDVFDNKITLISHLVVMLFHLYTVNVSTDYAQLYLASMVSNSNTRQIWGVCVNASGPSSHIPLNDLAGVLLTAGVHTAAVLRWVVCFKVTSRFRR